jgi:hypothetical protein
MSFSVKDEFLKKPSPGSLNVQRMHVIRGCKISMCVRCFIISVPLNFNMITFSCLNHANIWENSYFEKKMLDTQCFFFGKVYFYAYLDGNETWTQLPGTSSSVVSRPVSHRTQSLDLIMFTEARFPDSCNGTSNPVQQLTVNGVVNLGLHQQPNIATSGYFPYSVAPSDPCKSMPMS